MLVVVSDGAPIDDATLAANDPRILERHLREVNSETLRRPIRQQFPHDLGIAFDCQQQRASWRIGVLRRCSQSRKS